MRDEFNNNNVFSLSVNDLRVWVHLGCSDQEKFNPQMVSFNININFKKPPIGAESDLLQDTVCYLELIEMIKLHCQEKKFNLIEYLASSVHQKIYDSLSSYAPLFQSITVILHKISPPAPGIHGGVKWTHHVNY